MTDSTLQHLNRILAQRHDAQVMPRFHRRSPGVGAQRKTQLLRYFGSLKQVRSASLTELTAVPSLPERIAQAVYEHFHGTPVA